MRGRHRLGQALAVSALAHAALLAALLLGVRAVSETRPLLLHLVPLPAAPGPLGTVLSGPPPAGPSRGLSGARVRPAEARWGGAPALETAAAQAEVEPARAVSAARPGVLASQVASSGVAAGPLSGRGPGGAGGGGGGGGGPDTASPSLLRELQRRLAEAARHCYPAAAQRFRLRGEVPVHFCLDGQGPARALSLEGSTGSLLLDRSALECVVPGAEPVPGLEGCFLVPVHFGG